MSQQTSKVKTNRYSEYSSTKITPETVLSAVRQTLSNDLGLPEATVDRIMKRVGEYLDQ